MSTDVLDDDPGYKFLLEQLNTTHEQFVSKLRSTTTVLKELKKRNLLEKCKEDVKDRKLKEKITHIMEQQKKKLVFFIFE